MFIKLNHKGDTIVEVLIAIIIIGAILVGGYTTANASSNSVRTTQEHTIALGLLQSQIEGLKTIPTADIENGWTAYHSTYFCVTQSGTAPNEKAVLSSPATPTDSVCQFDNSGANHNTAEPIYYIKDTFQGVQDTDTCTYLIKLQATWAQLGGAGQNTVTLTYNLYVGD